MLRLAPPDPAQLCAMLDACAARIAARAAGRAAAEGAQGAASAEDAAGAEAAQAAELAGFQSAVRLLCDASAVAAEHWRDRHAAAAEALNPGVD